MSAWVTRFCPLIGSRRRRGPHPASPPVQAGDGLATAIAERDSLAFACMELADLVSSPSLAHKVLEALRRAGYDSIDPVGDVFYPQQHRAVETRPTSDSAQHNRIAAIERRGYLGHGRVVRVPEVAVFRLQEGAR
jgi:hypothetical protein